MSYLPSWVADHSDDVTVPRPPSLPRFPTLPSIPLDEDASLTRPMPSRMPTAPSLPRLAYPRAPQRLIPTMRPQRGDSRLPAVFYGLSVGVLLGALMCFAGVAFAPGGQAEEADPQLLATAGPGVKPASSPHRLPGVRAEDLPRVLVRAEDLPLARPASIDRRAYR